MDDDDNETILLSSHRFEDFDYIVEGPPEDNRPIEVMFDDVNTDIEIRDDKWGKTNFLFKTFLQDVTKKKLLTVRLDEFKVFLSEKYMTDFTSYNAQWINKMLGWDIKNV